MENNPNTQRRRRIVPFKAPPAPPTEAELRAAREARERAEAEQRAEARAERRMEMGLAYYHGLRD